MTHITEEDLLLHYYGELSDLDEHHARTHLQHCASCQGALHQLEHVLAIVDDAGTSGPDLPVGFERTVWARLEPHLRPSATGWLSWFVLSRARVAATVVILIAGAFAAGRLLPRPPEVPQAAAGVDPALVRERILLVDLGDHLDRSQMVLVELINGDDRGSEAVAAGRVRAEQLVSANRLYRQTAAVSGDNTTASVLDEIERVLVEVATAPELDAAHVLDEVRRRIESKGLLFKVRVASSEVRERQRDQLVRRDGQGSL